MAREISKAWLPKVSLSLGRDKDGAFERTLQKTISSLYKQTSNRTEYLLGL